MSIEHETTAEEIAALLNDDGSIDARMVQGNPYGYAYAKIPREMCERWTEHIENGGSIREIARQHGDITRSGVRYHVDGECKHSGVADE